MTSPSLARARYEASHPTDEARLVMLTEAALDLQAEVRQLRAEHIALSDALRRANNRLTRAWGAVDRLNDEVSEPAVGR